MRSLGHSRFYVKLISGCYIKLISQLSPTDVAKIVQCNLTNYFHNILFHEFFFFFTVRVKFCNFHTVKMVTEKIATSFAKLLRLGFQNPSQI